MKVNNNNNNPHPTTGQWKRKTKATGSPWEIKERTCLCKALQGTPLSSRYLKGPLLLFEEKVGRTFSCVGCVMGEEETRLLMG